MFGTITVTAAVTEKEFIHATIDHHIAVWPVAAAAALLLRRLRRRQDDASTTSAPPATTGGTDTDRRAPETTVAAHDGILTVPDDFPTIQEAVDAAAPGDLILVKPGTYNEAVQVTTDDLTIRGLDRNKVVLDGNFELDNGIRVLGAKGVAVENMTAHELHPQRLLLDRRRRVPRLVPHHATAPATTASTRSTRSTGSSSTSTRRAAPTPACTSASATRATP